MKIKEVIQYLETVAPLAYQESYDNAGLLVGDSSWEVKGILVCLDSTEAVIDEAITTGCNLVIAHHPIVFKGLKRFNGSTYVERVVMKAIKADIAIYAIHTNLDNVYQDGVNAKIAEKLGLINTQILASKKALKKLSVLLAPQYLDKIREAMGTLIMAKRKDITTIVNEDATTGMAKMECLFPAPFQGQIINILSNNIPNGQYQYYTTTLDNRLSNVGSGMIGVLPEPMDELDFLKHLKTQMQVACIKHTELLSKKVHRVAVCGGAGGFLLSHAIRQKADFFITSDYKYHEFFDAEHRIVIADIGHYESEQFTINLLHKLLSQKFRNFAPQITSINTNPVKYFV